VPWARTTYERITTKYNEAIKRIGKKKAEDLNIPKQEMLLRIEVLRRDFTKRQLKIISMLLTLSYYVGKKQAIVPKMQDWEIAGISKIKARTELMQLKEMNVINCDEEQNLFSLKDPREWKVKFHSGYNDERADEILVLNMKDSGVYVDES
jgi:hypothetical protein